MKRSFATFLLTFCPLMSWASGIYCPDLFWVRGEFLYWTAFQGGMEFVADYNPLSTGSFTGAHGRELEFDWSPGARIQIGTLYESWDASLGYTYYSTRAKSSVDGNFFPTLNYFASTAGGSATLVTHASADWDLNFQYLDADFGHPLRFGNTFSFHPHLGVRGAWICQNASVAYSGGSIPAGSYFVNLKNDFSGVGLKVGLDARYQFFNFGALYSDFSISTLYAHFNVTQIQNQLGIEQVHFSRKLNRIVPTAQLNIGISWEWDMCWPCTSLFVFSVAAEGQYWWRQNQTTFFTDSVNPIHTSDSEDLGLIGFNLRADLYF